MRDDSFQHACFCHIHEKKLKTLTDRGAVATVCTVCVCVCASSLVLDKTRRIFSVTRSWIIVSLTKTNEPLI